ncbi:MAG: hypothetical protein CML07_03085 [Psychrobacter sp.]|nr:hypothetical protein [Psychrobacter sp.]
MDSVPQINLQTAEDITDLQTTLGGCVFRGHASKEWKLTSTLERICSAYHVEGPSRAEREKNCLLEFQRRAYHYIQDQPGSNNLLEWIALLQHYGGPTRLVDVSHSLFVAAFFAIENATDDAVIWAFNTGKLTSSGEPEGPRSPTSESIAEANAVLRGETKASGVRLVKPFRLNERLASQQGAFLMPLSLSEPFESQLSKQLDINIKTLKPIKGYEQSLSAELMTSSAVKIIIPRDIQSQLIRLLDAANVNATTLFPGLEGYARSLRVGFRIFD